jgi:hypothetical protein
MYGSVLFGLTPVRAAEITMEVCTKLVYTLEKEREDENRKRHTDAQDFINETMNAYEGSEKHFALFSLAKFLGELSERGKTAGALDATMELYRRFKPTSHADFLVRAKESFERGKNTVEAEKLIERVMKKEKPNETSIDDIDNFENNTL